MNNAKNNSCLVVGDIYDSFANGDNVLKETDLIVKLLSKKIKFESIILGQGISNQSMEKILLLANTQKIECVTDILDRATVQMTHKTKPENILISKPINCGEKLYKHQLVIDNCFDRLSDHVTGQHIGAMLLIEAARQGVISVLGAEYPESDDVSWGYVLQSLNTEYSDYAFPIPTDIFVKLEEKEKKNQRQISTLLIIKFYQNVNCISEMTMDVQLIDKKLLEKIECKKSQKSYTELLNTEVISQSSKVVMEKI